MADVPSGDEEIAVGDRQRSGTERSGRDGLTKPDHVGANPGIAVRTTRGLVSAADIDLDPAIFHRTSIAVDIAVKFYDGTAAGALMQAVDILCDEGQLRQQSLKRRDSRMCRIGACRGKHFPPPLIPLPDQGRVTLESGLGCQIFGAVIGPEPGLPVTKGGYTALGRYPRSGENDGVA